MTRSQSSIKKWMAVKKEKYPSMIIFFSLIAPKVRHVQTYR